MKNCTKCNQEFPETSEHFYIRADTKKLNSRCKSCCQSFAANTRKKFPNRNKEYMKKYREDFPEKVKESYIKHYSENREIIISKQKERTRIYKSNRRKIDPSFKLRENVSRTIRRYLLNDTKEIKSGKSIWNFLSYTSKDLKLHLESQFESWMSWENYGIDWNIDHIVPQSLLLYSNFQEENFIKCWSLSNLRPLGVIENIKKGNKI